MPSTHELPERMVLTPAEIKVIQRMRQLPQGSLVIKIQDGEPVFLQEIVKNVKL